MMRIEDLDTPVPVIDLDRVEHNLTKMQAVLRSPRPVRHCRQPATDDRAVIDAGTKSLTSDLVATSVGPGYGMILGSQPAVSEPHAKASGMWDNLLHRRITKLSIIVGPDAQRTRYNRSNQKR